mmetsp:Transcript_9397/g.13940  ORF Transcript_9397/g.13940 Transcript_9397/m.13940 type:complete len:535 (-) Transcript_9397:52-1656(-)
MQRSKDSPLPTPTTDQQQPKAERYGRKYASKKRSASSSAASLADTATVLITLVIIMYTTGVIKSYVALPTIQSDAIWFPGWDMQQEVAGDEKNKDSNSLTRDSNTRAWPVSVRYETFETIKHPGDPSSTLSVPTFYSDHITDGRLMTRAEADAVGIEKNNMPTIFVAIASYRDWQCRTTLESIFNRAKFPERVRVAVVDQIEDGVDVPCDVPIEPCENSPEQALCKYKDHVDVYEMEAALAVGPVFARHIGHRMYRGETYAMQCDAHVTFTANWDVDILGQFDSTKNDMAVLSTYLSDIQGSIDERTGASLRHTRPIMCNTDYEQDQLGKHLRHESQPEAPATIKGTPQLQPYWAAGFSFSRGHFILNVPYDQYQPMVFQGEEISIGIRGFTFGYDFYAPERSVCFHMYAEGVNKAKRKKVSLFWEHANLYKGAGKDGMRRLKKIIHMGDKHDHNEYNHADEHKYGIGKVREPEKFFETFGIHTDSETTENHLCSFVQSGKMHVDFSRHLRPDGMGIDYGKINYVFKDPRPGQP